MPKLNQYEGHLHGSVLKSIFRMGLPSMIGFGASNVYDIVDMFWLAKLGVEPPAAITFFFSFYWVISSANMIAGAGSVSVISQNFGSGDLDVTEASIKETLILKAVLALGCGAIGLAILKPVMTLLGASGNVLSMALEYGTIQLAGMVFSFCAFSVYTALRGIGNPKWAMSLMLTSICLNIVLDPLLIFGWWIFPELGVAGAAWASIIGYAFSVFGGLALLYGGWVNVRLRLIGKVKIKIQTMLKILKIGFPSGISSISFSLSRSIVMGLVAVYGTEAVAAYGIGNRVSAFGIMVIVGLGLGISALIGQILGAENRERAWKTANQSIAISMLLMVGFGAICFFAAGPLMRMFFTPNEPGAERVYQIGVVLMKVLAFSFPFIGQFITIENVFSGAGKNMPAMVLSIAGNWVLEIPLIIALASLLGMAENGVWLAITLSSAIGSTAFYLYYRRKTWLSHSVKSAAVT